MGGNKNKPIKILLYRGNTLNKNVASYNRNLAVEKMVSNVFNYELILPQKNNKTNKNKYVRYLNGKVGMFLVLSKINRYTKDKSYNYALFLRSIDPITALFCWLFAKPKGIKLAIERNEFPAAILSNNKVKKQLYKLFVLPWHYRLFDVVFLMTDELISFYSKYVKKNCIVQKLPMSVDMTRFSKTQKPIDKNYIFYAGSLSDKKDGVKSLIVAFSEIKKKHPGISLLIAGSSKKGLQEKELKETIEFYNLEDFVFLLGNVSREKIPEYLLSAKILALPRPDSLQARGGFPTKLGEYLAAEKPVIVTKVGETPLVLSDKEVFFISPQNIVDELVDKVEFILNNYEDASEVANNGKVFAKKHFSIEANQVHIKNAFEKLFF